MFENTWGKAAAGHGARVGNFKSKDSYDNKLTDLVDMYIAQAKADQMIKELNDTRTSPQDFGQSTRRGCLP
jgi:hypothetical protein